MKLKSQFDFKMANNKRLLISIFLIAFTIRLVTAIVYLNFDSQALTMHRPFLPFREGSNDIWRVVGDGDKYNTLASNILAYGTIGETYGRAPLYPIFLAICYFFIGFNIFAFFIPQITLASINSILILFLAQNLFSNRIGIMASLFYAFNPHFILYSIELQAETLYFFLILAVFLLCQKLLFKPAIKYAAIVGIFMALAALCRMVFLAFVPFIFLWFIIAFYRERRKMLLLLTAVFMSFSLIYGIWFIRDNKMVVTEVIFSLSKTAWEVRRTSDLRESKNWMYESDYIHHAGKELLSFVNWVKENPKRYLGRCTRHLRTFLFKPYAEGVSFRHKIVSSFIFFIIYPLGYLGIARAVWEKKKIAFLALLFIGSMIVFHTFHFLTLLDGELRYRLPVELFIIIFAAYGLRTMMNLLQIRKFTHFKVR